jgi:TonB-dependent receptor
VIRPVPVFRPAALALAVALCFTVCGSARSQQVEAAQLPPVVITGQAMSTDRALRDQAAADNVISVVRADGIGRLPDRNVAEALQRLTGVSVERDQGEGRYVRIRGLGPDLNAVTINGSLVPASDSDRRAVALDVLPASLIRSLVVSKTLLPDMDANSLGGSIDVQTISAFDHKGRFVSVDLGAGRADIDGRTSPSGALVWSDVFAGGKLGIAAGLSIDERRFGSDNTETGGAWDGDALEEFERRDYTLIRRRSGLALNVEWKAAEGQLVYARAMASRFSDNEQRLAHIIAFDSPQAEGALGDAESVRELKDRKDEQSIRSLVLGTDQRFGDWRFKAAFGASEAKEETPRHLANAVFEAEDLFSDVGFSNTRQPRLLAPAAINDAALYALTEIELESSLHKDRERNLRLDLSRALSLGGVETELKFGAKASRREKTNSLTIWKFEDLGDPPLSLSDAQRSLVANADSAPAYAFGSFGPGIRSTPILALLSGADLEAARDDEESTLGTLRVDEDIDAAYLQSTFQLGASTVIAGLRHEATELRAVGSGLNQGVFEPIEVRQRYDHWLPGLHLRHDLDKDTSLRAAWSNAVVRPTLEQLSPSFVFDGSEASFGNPNLKPLRAANLDLGVERQLGYAGAVSAYVFYKRIRDFVYATDLAGSGDWVTFDEALTWANGEKAKVSGLELSWQRAWRELPGVWGGLVTGVNATFTRSSATIGRVDAGVFRTREIALPSQSDRALNLVLGYETPTIGVRLAANHKSDYLLEVGDALDPDGDLTVDAQTHIDLSLRYSFSRQLTVVFEALNLSDEPYYVYARQRSRNAQFETYGRSFRINLKWVLL